MPQKFILIGYSGHALVAADIITEMEGDLLGYCDKEEKNFNPLNLNYLGPEFTTIELLKKHVYFISIGDNALRSKISLNLFQRTGHSAKTIIHPSAIIAKNTAVGNGCMVAARVVVNALATIGAGVILNSGCIIEHECQIGDYAHIAPGAVLAGNVSVGEKTFVGANAVVKQGIKIGKNVTVGAGTVILKDVPDGATIVGNPGRIIKT